MAELLNHRVNVREGALRRLLLSLLHLDVTHLDLNLLTSILRQLLHVPLHKFNLRVQVRVARVSILELFLEFEISHLELMDLPLVLLFAFFEAHVGFGEFVELLRKLSELLVKLIH